METILRLEAARAVYCGHEFSMPEIQEVKFLLSCIGFFMYLKDVNISNHLHGINWEYEAPLFVDSQWLENFQVLLFVGKFESTTKR